MSPKYANSPSVRRRVSSAASILNNSTAEYADLELTLLNCKYMSREQ